MDGIVYGAAVSLGFAAMENTVYVLDTGMDQAVARAVTAIPAHASFGAIMGYFVGRAIYHSHRSAAGSLLLGFLCPVGLHTFYNFPLLAIEACDDCHSPRPFLALFLAVLVITLTWAFWLINKLRREQETQLGLADRPRRVR
jgi:RsiW-degrading membrane proteinase PrsW (M82 family)